MPHKITNWDEEERFLLKLVEEAYARRNKGTKMARLANDVPFRLRGAVVPVGAQVTFFSSRNWQDASVACVSTARYIATLRVKASSIDIRYSPTRRDPYSYSND